MTPAGLYAIAALRSAIGLVFVFAASIAGTAGQTLISSLLHKYVSGRLKEV
jgi:hypothetical protein